MAWYIGGTLFEGTVVTVGAGKDYETIEAARIGTCIPGGTGGSDTGDVLMLLDAGVYARWGADYQDQRSFYIKAVAPREEVILTDTSIWNWHGGFRTHKKMIIEGCNFVWNHSASAMLYTSGTTGETIISKCKIRAEALWRGIYVTRWEDDNFAAIFRHCDIITNNHLVEDEHYTNPWNISNCEVIKTLTNTVSSGIYTVGDWKTLDYVTEATEGYGPDYGTNLIKEVLGIPPIVNYYKQTRGLS